MIDIIENRLFIEGTNFPVSSMLVELISGHTIESFAETYELDTVACQRALGYLAEKLESL